MSSFVKTSPTFFSLYLISFLLVTHEGTYRAQSFVRKTRQVEKLFIVQAIFSTWCIPPIQLLKMCVCVCLIVIVECEFMRITIKNSLIFDCQLKAQS